MQHLSKGIFVMVLESIRNQVVKDKLSTDLVSQVFPGSEIACYDNSTIIKALLELTRVFIPRDKNGHCELEHYCFELDFGKHHESGYLSPEAFYDSLFPMEDDFDQQQVGIYHGDSFLQMIQSIVP